MSTDTIFRHLGRLNETYTSIGPGKTREEYLNLFSRTSYSSENEWPYSSPFAGFYDVSNTSTRLILVNQRHKFSHLRGQVAPKEPSTRPTEDETKNIYEQILEEEQQEPKSKHTHNIHLPRTPVDPERHFESRPHTAGSANPRRARSLSARRRRSSSVSENADRLTDNFKVDPSFDEALWEYHRYQCEKTKRPKLGLQQYYIREPTNRLLKQSGIYRNPALTHGQKLYLLEKCHVYDIDDAKTRHTRSYLQVLNKRLTADFPAYKLDLLYKPEFRLNNPRDYSSYEKFVKTPRPTVRPINTGYFTSKQPHPPRLPSGYKKQQINHRSNSCLDKQDFLRIRKSFNDKQTLSKDNSSTSSRLRSSSSFSSKNDNNIILQLRRQPKQIPKIPVLPTQSDD